eukprot:GEMP01014296.1.p1 GENE.GEMP01014296.1~~GEMP01014296.1.p1  ORF type:complete len:690 (+),score=182.99 GEMP01014296.1:118-2187(+)
MARIDTETFSAADFDASVFVLKARRRLPLPELQKVLSTHSIQVKGELQQLLNEKFSDFVSLANRMQSVDRTAAPLWEPLQQQRQQADAFRTLLDGVLDRARQAREERRKIVASRRRLETYVRGIQTLDEVKEARARLDAGTKLDFLQSHTAFECMARNIQRLQLEVEPYRESDIFKPLVASLEEIKGDFTSSLLKSLEETLITFQKQWKSHGVPSESVAKTPYAQPALALAYLTRNLQTLRLTDKVTRTFHDVFVAKILTDASRGDMLLQAGQTGLSAFFGHVKTLLAEDSLFFYITKLMCLPSSDTLAYAVPGLELSSAALGVPVIECMLQYCLSVFMPAVPDVFVRNYTDSMDFLQSLESSMDEPEQRRWRGHKTVVDFKKKWKTDVYCAVRHKEITQKFDAALIPQENIGDEKFSFLEEHFSLRASRDLWLLIHRVWAPEVYLPPLFHKFFKLCVEMISKYFDYVRNLVKAMTGKSLAASICDIFASKDHINTTFRSLVTRRDVNHEKHERLHAVVNACIDEIAGEGDHLGVELGEVLHTQTMQQVLRELRAVKGIPPLYRMTTRPAPTEASAYVDATLKLLTTFERDVSVLPLELSRSWTRRCVEESLNALVSEMSGMLESLDQQEKSLQKLRGATNGAQRGGIPPNIFKQLRLDIDSYQTQCQKTFNIELSPPDIPLLAREQEA